METLVLPATAVPFGSGDTMALSRLSVLML